ncbi:hypothetical protein [Draconibacterium orientale]|jgi:hypothetical protein|uniref:hypothetical protein n=1 Tax=Draconibacterium orientale TaxID=1168034 RepID=UPI002A0A4AE6|nr:hypothetical protein [Draconibacterium orientale]
MKSNALKLTQEVRELKIVSASEISEISTPLFELSKETISPKSFTSSFQDFSVYHILKQQLFGIN